MIWHPPSKFPAKLFPDEDVSGSNNESKYVLVTIQWKDACQPDIDKDRYVVIAKYLYFPGVWVTNEGCEVLESDTEKVVAWMYLPKPKLANGAEGAESPAYPETRESVSPGCPQSASSAPSVQLKKGFDIHPGGSYFKCLACGVDTPYCVFKSDVPKVCPFCGNTEKE